MGSRFVDHFADCFDDELWFVERNAVAAVVRDDVPAVGDERRELVLQASQQAFVGVHECGVGLVGVLPGLCWSRA